MIANKLLLRTLGPHGISDSTALQAPTPQRMIVWAEGVNGRDSLAAERSAKLAELKKHFELWPTEVDANCRKLGIEPKMPKAITISNK